MLIITSQAQGSDGGYRHLTLVSTTTGAETVLTSGRFVVMEILKWDAESNLIFYTANTPEASEVQHVYAVRAQPGQISQCLTCGLHNNQTYFSVEFSATGHNLVLITEGPSVPRVDLYEWTVVADGWCMIRL